MLVIVGIALFAALGLGAFTIISEVDERATVRASLRQLDGYEVENVRERELLEPVAERVVSPVLKAVVRLGHRYTPAGYVDNDTHDFGSILRTIEGNFGLGLIGPGYYADAYADDLSAFFTLTTPRPFAATSAQVAPAYFREYHGPATAPDDD